MVSLFKAARPIAIKLNKIKYGKSVTGNCISTVDRGFCLLIGLPVVLLQAFLVYNKIK